MDRSGTCGAKAKQPRVFAGGSDHISCSLEMHEVEEGLDWVHIRAQCVGGRKYRPSDLKPDQIDSRLFCRPCDDPELFLLAIAGPTGRGLQVHIVVPRYVESFQK